MVALARRARRAACWLLALTLGYASFAPRPAAAHGRPSTVGELRAHPTEPDVLVARATFGLIVSEDGGASWRWICAAVVGADPEVEDPAIAVMPDGAIVAGTFGGLTRSHADRCEWSVPHPDLSGRYVIDVDAPSSSPQTVYAVQTSGGLPDQLQRSVDAAQGFEALGPPIEDVLIERVRAAPSDDRRIYLSGAIPSTPSGGRAGYVLRSVDGGESFEAIEVPLQDGERNVLVLAVDPTDADRALVRIRRSIIDERAERLLLTEDGGESFRTALEARRISGAAFSADGARAWASSAGGGGLYESDDGGASFAQLAPGHLTCLGPVTAEHVWHCANEDLDGYSIGRSAVTGAALEPVLRLRDMSGLVDCPRCSQAGAVCREYVAELASDLGQDGGPPPAPSRCVDGSVVFLDGGPPAPDGAVDAGEGAAAPDGCGCRAAGSGAPPPPQWLLAMMASSAVAWRRRRRRGG